MSPGFDAPPGPGAAPGAAAPPEAPPIALDGLGYGIQGLDAIVVLHLADAHVHAAFVREGVTLSPAEAAPSLRDAYRACQAGVRRALGAGRRRSSMPASAAGRDLGGDGPDPVVTLEIGPRAVLLRRARAHLVACVFDASMPLGMARLLSSRLAGTIAPELPREGAADALHDGEPPLDGWDSTDALDALMTRPRPPAQRDASSPPPSRAGAADVERTRRLLALLDARAPEPHVARLRLSLRVGLTPLALEHPDALGVEAAALIETAVQDILGLDGAALRRVL